MTAFLITFDEAGMPCIAHHTCPPSPTIREGSFVEGIGSSIRGRVGVVKAVIPGQHLALAVWFPNINDGHGCAGLTPNSEGFWCTAAAGDSYTVAPLEEEAHHD